MAWCAFLQTETVTICISPAPQRRWAGGVLYNLPMLFRASPQTAQSKRSYSLVMMCYITLTRLVTNNSLGP